MSTTRSELLGGSACLFMLSALFLASATGTVAGGEGRADYSEATTQYDFAAGLMRRGLYEDAAGEFRKFVSRYPGDERRPKAMYYLGECLYALDRKKQAALALAEYVQRYPEHDLVPKAFYRIGLCSFESGAYQEAATAFELAGRGKLPEDLHQSLFYYLGRSYQERARWPEAEKALEKALRGSKELRDLSLFCLGTVRREQGQHAEAQEPFETLLKESPEHRLAPATTLALAQSYQQLGRTERSLTVLDHLLATWPKSLQAARGRLHKAWSLHEMGKYEEARAEARAFLGTKQAEGESKNAALYLSGLCLKSLGRHEQAAEVFGRVGEGAYEADAAYWRIWSLFLGGDYGPAAKASAAYLARDKVSQGPTVHYLAAQSLYFQGKVEEALAHFVIAAEKAPEEQRPGAAFAMALCYDHLERTGHAIDAYRSFLNRYPQHERVIPALLSLGDLYVDRDECEPALPVLEKVLSDQRATQAQREHALAQQGVCYYRIEQYENMKKVYERLYELAPEGTHAAEALYWRAWIAQQHDKAYDEAAKLFELFLGRFPEHENAPRARYRRAMSLFQGGKEKAASQAFLEIVTKYPAIEVRPAELLWLADLLMEEGRYREAEGVYGKLLAKKPEADVASLAMFRRAECYRKLADYRPALELYRKLLARDDPAYYGRARFGVGYSLFHLEKYQEAGETFAAMELPPGDPLEAHKLYYQALTEEKLGRGEKAVLDLMKLGLVYDNEELCGKALLKASEIYLAQGKEDRAQAALREMTSEEEGTYGQKYRTGPYAREAAERLAALKARQEKKEEERAEQRRSAEEEEQRPQSPPPAEIPLPEDESREAL